MAALNWRCQRQKRKELIHIEITVVLTGRKCWEGRPAHPPANRKCMPRPQLGRNNKSPNLGHRGGQNRAITAKLPDNLFLAAWLLVVGKGKEIHAQK